MVDIGTLGEKPPKFRLCTLVPWVFYSYLILLGFVVSVWVLETRSQMTGLELIPLPSPSKCWSYMHMLPLGVIWVLRQALTLWPWLHCIVQAGLKHTVLLPQLP